MHAYHNADGHGDSDNDNCHDMRRTKGKAADDGEEHDEDGGCDDDDDDNTDEDKDDQDDLEGKRQTRR